MPLAFLSFFVSFHSFPNSPPSLFLPPTLSLSRVIEVEHQETALVSLTLLFYAPTFYFEVLHSLLYLYRAPYLNGLVGVQGSICLVDDKKVLSFLPFLSLSLFQKHRVVQ